MEQRAHIIRISPLELAMRDVREALSDYAADFTFAAGSFDLLSIEPPPEAFLRPRAPVYQLQGAGHATRKAN